MKHIRCVTRQAYGIGIGHYLLLAGQVLGILAMIFIDKPAPDPPQDNGDR